MDNPRIRRALRLLLGYGLAIAALLFTAQTLNIEISQLGKFPNALTTPAIIASAGCMLCHILLNREGFVLLCNSLESGVSPTALRRAWAMSILTKYIPGGLWQLVGRGLLMRRLGSKHSSSISSGLLEQAISMSLCLSIAAVIYLVISHKLFLAAAATALFSIVAWLLSCLLPVVRQRKTFLKSVTTYGCAMAFFFGTYALLIPDLPPLELAMNLFSGTLAGMIAFIVPGGIGIRESAISALASDRAAQLFTVAIIARVITVSVECLVFLLGMTNPEQKPERNEAK